MARGDVTSYVSRLESFDLQCCGLAQIADAGQPRTLSLLAPAAVAAQEVDDSDAPLGDVARNLRKQIPSSQQGIIDNDNLSKVMDDAAAIALRGLL